MGYAQTPYKVQAIDGADAGFVELFVPGRLCLFGEHSDWAGSYARTNPKVRPGRTIVCGTEQGLYCRAQRLDGRELVVRATTEDGKVKGPHRLDLDDPEALLREAEVGGFWAYAAGTAHKIATEHIVGGMRLDNYRTTLPLKKGLSSSAAICVLVARAFNRVYGLRLTVRGEMEVAYQGERLTPSMCGRMDQASAFGSVPLQLTFRGETVAVDRLLLGAPLFLVLVDLMASKDTVAILAGLQAAYPHPEQPEHEALHELLGATNERIILRAAALLRDGDAQRIGALMTEAQILFDQAAAPCCPQQLRSPILHRVLKYDPIADLIWGGKGVGSQGDGTAQLLCRSQDSQAAVCRIVTDQLGMHAMSMTLQPTDINDNLVVELENRIC